MKFVTKHEMLVQQITLDPSRLNLGTYKLFSIYENSEEGSRFEILVLAQDSRIVFSCRDTEIIAEFGSGFI